MTELGALAESTIQTYRNLQQAKFNLAHAEQALELAEAQARISGRIEGRNERERKDLMLIAYVEDEQVRPAYEIVQQRKTEMLLSDVDYYVAERKYQVARYEFVAAHPDIKATGLLTKLFG